MDKDDSGYFSMTGRVINLFDTTPTAWQTEEPVATTYATLVAKSKTGLSLINKKESTDPHAFTVTKDVVFSAMKVDGLLMSKRMTSFARDTKNTTLLTMVKYSKTSLAEGSESAVMNRCIKLADQATLYLAQATKYKITAESIAKLRKLIADYEGAPEERDNVAGIKQVTGQEIRDDIKEIREIFEDLDDKVEGLIEDKNFRDRYAIARVLGDQGGSGGSAKGTTDTEKKE